MSYNKGFELELDGYDKNTGCIAFPELKWADWYDYFIGSEPERFYAYIVRLSDGAFVGEVNAHICRDAFWYEMGIVLEAKYRGQGYSEEALGLLLEYTFRKLGAKAVHNSFEVGREAALRAHMALGFEEYGIENGIIELALTKEQYLERT